MQQGTIELAVVPAAAELPARRLAGPSELPGLQSLPQPAVIGLLASPGRARVKALREIAAGLGQGLAVTGGAREVLIDRRDCGFEYLGQWPLGTTAETGLWRLHADTAAAPMLPQLRNRQPAELSLAVLPFRALGAEAGTQDAAWAVSEAVTAALSRFRSLDVLARGAAWAWRLSPLPAFEIGHRLGVRYLLDGLARPDPAGLRLDLSLAETAGARTIWTERCLCPAEDLRGLAREVAGEVAAAVTHHLQRDAVEHATPDGAAAAAGPDATGGDARAHLIALQGALRLRGMTGDDIDAAAALADTALALDPHLAPALALRARCAVLGWLRGSGPLAGAEAARTALAPAAGDASHATRADPLDARGFAALGLVALYRRDFDAARAAYDRAMSLNPGDAEILAEAARARLYLGQAEQALELMDRAVRLDPFYPDDWLWTIGAAHLASGRSRDALGAALRMQHAPAARLLVACCHALLGDAPAAEALAAEIRAETPGFRIAGWLATQPMREAGDAARWAEALSLAGLR